MTLDPRDADPFRAEGTDDEPETPGDWDGWRGRLGAFLLGAIVAFGLVIAFGVRAS